MCVFFVFLTVDFSSSFKISFFGYLCSVTYFKQKYERIDIEVKTDHFIGLYRIVCLKASVEPEKSVALVQL